MIITCLVHALLCNVYTYFVRSSLLTYSVVECIFWRVCVCVCGGICRYIVTLRIYMAKDFNPGTSFSRAHTHDSCVSGSQRKIHYTFSTKGKFVFLSSFKGASFIHTHV